MRKDESPIIGETEKVERNKASNKAKIKEFLRWYLSFDAKDAWNWVLLGLAILIFWWAVRMILQALRMP